MAAGTVLNTQIMLSREKLSLCHNDQCPCQKTLNVGVFSAAINVTSFKLVHELCPFIPVSMTLTSFQKVRNVGKRRRWHGEKGPLQHTHRRVSPRPLLLVATNDLSRPYPTPHPPSPLPRPYCVPHAATVKSATYTLTRLPQSSLAGHASLPQGPPFQPT